MENGNKYMAKKINSEMVIDDQNFNLKFGTTNKTTPSAVYLEGSTFVTPLTQKVTYDANIETIKKSFSSLLKNKLSKNDIYSNNFLFIIESAYDRMKCDKKSYLYFQCHLKPREIHKFKELEKISHDTIQTISNDLTEIIRENGFMVSKTKN